jgi:hypothetical protein
MTARLGALAGATARGALLVAAVFSLMSARPARAEGPGQLIINEENDAFSDSGDKHYTQGLRFAYLSSPVTPGGFWDGPFEALGWALPIFDDSRVHQRRYLWTIAGQSLFTPEDTNRFNPDPADRPYAGWLYTGASLLQDTEGRMLENFEVLAGIVGPDALGRQTQNDFHQFISVGEARGWGYQLKDEPGVMVSYERKYRLALPLVGNFGFDAIPEAGVTLGNVMTYGSAGIMFRMGQNLAADYGPARVRPSLSGNGWFDRDRLDGAFGWQVFAGAQGRAVGYNIFLDGNTLASSRHVERKVLVGDLMGGVSLFWADAIRLDLVVTQRSPEFEEQRKPDRFGGFNLTFRFF